MRRPGEAGGPELRQLLGALDRGERRWRLAGLIIEVPASVHDRRSVCAVLATYMSSLGPRCRESARAQVARTAENES